MIFDSSVIRSRLVANGSIENSMRGIQAGRLVVNRYQANDMYRNELYMSPNNVYNQLESRGVKLYVYPYGKQLPYSVIYKRGFIGITNTNQFQCMPWLEDHTIQITNEINNSISTMGHNCNKMYWDIKHDLD